MTTRNAARIAALTRSTPLARTVQWGVLHRTLLGGQYIEEWMFDPGDTDTGVYTTDLTTLREENPARDLTAISAILVVFGTPHVGSGGARRPVMRNDQVMLSQGATAETFRIVERETAPGGFGTRLLLEVL